MVIVGSHDKRYYQNKLKYVKGMQRICDVPVLPGFEAKGEQRNAGSSPDRELE